MTVTAFVIMFAALSFCNIDGVIAKYDLNEYSKGNLPYFSFSMMSDLSSGAAPEIIRYRDTCTDKMKCVYLTRYLTKWKTTVTEEH